MIDYHSKNYLSYFIHYMHCDARLLNTAQHYASLSFVDVMSMIRALTGVCETNSVMRALRSSPIHGRQDSMSIEARPVISLINVTVS